MASYMVTYNEVLMYGVNRDPILLIGFHGIEGYSPVCLIQQYGLFQSIPHTVVFLDLHKDDFDKLENNNTILERPKKGKT